MASVARTQARLLAAEMARQPGQAAAIGAYLDAHPRFVDEMARRSVGAAARVSADYEAFKKP
jgi:hypothetical protein